MTRVHTITRYTAALWVLTLPFRLIGWAVNLRPTRGRAWPRS